jgi:ADP-heptose:LPS heptosyltransferase
MKKIFWIDGGAGRAVAAIPALIKFGRLNPDVDWACMVATWDFLYWGISELQDRTYGIDTKGVFDNVIKNADQIITPEPYRNPAYFRQEISLVEAFDREINNTRDHSDLGLPVLKFNQQEIMVAKNTIEDLKSAQKKQKTVIFQPFGRGAKVDNRQGVFDEESRSLSQKDYIYLVKKIAMRYNTIFFGEPEFQLKQDTVSQKYTCDLRQWGALIQESDYFIGCDSVGQHMARAVGTPGTVIFGSTFPINTSYPDYFQIIETQQVRKYTPIRIAGLDATLSNRLNEGTINFTTKELDDIFNAIVSDIEKKAR